MIKNYLKSYAFLYGLILIISIIISLINYFIPFNNTIIKLIIPLISLLISSIILGKNIKEKAYLEGIKFSLGYILITCIIKLITKSSFSYKTIIIYFAMIISSIIGSMIGINRKKG